MSMVTEIIQKKKAGKRIMGRGLWLWVGSLLVGVVCFVAVWAFRGMQVNREGSLLQPLLGAVYDQGATGFARQNLRKGPPGDVVVVAIKDSTYKDLGDRATEKIPSFVPGVAGPMSFDNGDHRRAFHGRLLQNLKDLGAKTVVFDIVFDRDVPKIDDYFAAAIKSHGNVILSGALDETVEGGNAEASSLTTPNLTLYPVAKGMGTVNIPLDTDKTVRRFFWWSKSMDPDSGDDAWFPTLGVAAAAAFSGKDPKTIIKEEVEPKGTFLGQRIFWEKFGATYRSMFRYYGENGSPTGPGTVVNYENVFRTGQDPAAREQLRKQINGKIVIIGDETRLAQDNHRVPVVSRTSTFGSANQMAGPEIQANIAQAALRGGYPHDAPVVLVGLLAFVACLMIALVGRLLPPGPTVLFGLLLIGAMYWGSVKLVTDIGVFLEPVTAALGVVATMIGETSFMYLAERKEREATRRQLARQVGAGVASKLTDEDWPELGGESREITMLFSDLQGFTSISESLTSPELCSLLNRYFGVIFPIVGKYEGVLDKLMGDGMMVYFGWPVRKHDHAERAIRCAMEMQDALEAWQRQPENAGMPPLRTRVGIHTGTATIGEVGGSFGPGNGTRAEFSVIGDVVNVASRLEGMNKDYGTLILISETTKNSAGEFVPMTYRGVATVRGRKEPMPVFSVDQEALSRQRTTARGQKAVTSMRVDLTGQPTEHH